MAQVSTTRTEYSIDASGKSLGRVASDVAVLLLGKRRADFTYHTVANVRVIVRNITGVRITGKKATQSRYYRHSGYPGGLRSRTLGDRFTKDPKGLFREVVRRMLPANKLRPRMLKNLTIE